MPVLAGDLFGVMQSYVGRPAFAGASINKTAAVEHKQGWWRPTRRAACCRRGAWGAAWPMVKDTRGIGHTLLQLRNPWGGDWRVA